MLKRIASGMMLTLLLAGMVASAFHNQATSIQQNPPHIQSGSSTFIEQQVVALVNGSRAYDYDLELEKIAFKYPTFRAAGSPGAYEAANWIKTQFESFGLETWLEPFEFMNWTLQDEPSLVIDDDGNQSTIGDQTIIYSFQCEHCSWPTPESGAFADLVILPLPEAANRGEIGLNPINATEWDAVNTTGKVVLIGREVRWDSTWEQSFKNKLTAQPPTAVVYTWWYDWMSFTPPFFSSAGGRPISNLGDYYWDLQIPVGFVSYNDGLWIRDRENAVDVSTNVSIRSVISTGTHYNVVGKIRGCKNPEKIVVISGHYDTVMCGGFCDNGAGTAGIIEAAKVFSDAAKKGFYNSSYTLLFLALAGEELGLVGSINYVKQHKSEMANIIAVINLDCVGSDDLYVTETDPVDSFDLDQVISTAAEDLGVTVTFESPGGSDQESFRNPSWANGYYYWCWGLDAGISDAAPVESSAMLISYPLLYSDKWSMGAPGWIHTGYDNSTSTQTLNWVEAGELGDHIKVAVLATMRIKLVGARALAWTRVGAIYLHPSSPENPLVIAPDKPPNSWWTVNFALFASQKYTDEMMLNKALSAHPSKSLAIYFPQFLADVNAFGTKYLEELYQVVFFFYKASFHILLFLGRPDFNAYGDFIDPVKDPSSRAYLLRNINTTICFRDMHNYIGEVSLYWMAYVSSYSSGDISEYNKQLKNIVNAAGPAFLVHVDGPWWDKNLTLNGYTPQSVSPKSGCSDGLFAESWAQGSLPNGLRELVPEYFASSQIAMICDVPNGYINPSTPNAIGNVENDMNYWFECIQNSGITSWYMWDYFGISLDVPSTYSLIYPNATSLTLKGEITRARTQTGLLYQDVAIINIETDKSVIVKGSIASINVTVLNQGDVSETFNLTAYCNTTAIDAKEITLTSENSTSVTFAWNTAGAEPGSCTISAYAWPVPGETDTSDNTFTYGAVKVVDYPVAHFMYSPVNPLVNETVAFNATLSTPNGGTIIDYAWNFGDGFQGRGVIVYHSYLKTGAYNVTLTVIDSEGLSNTAIATITVLIHDVTVASATPSAKETYEGQTLNITVVVQNNGNFTETFNVTAYANTTIIQTQTVSHLAPSKQTTLTFSWNTTQFLLGNYTIKVEASVVPGETNVTDNVMVDGVVNVISEFPSFLVLPLFMAATPLAVIVYRRKHST